MSENTTTVRAENLREGDTIVAVEVGGEQRVFVIGRGECVNVTFGPSSESTLALHEEVTILSRDTTPNFELSLDELDDLRMALSAGILATKDGATPDHPNIIAKRERLIALSIKLDPWRVVMDNWRNDVYGEYHLVRDYAVKDLEESLSGSGEGIGSSDVNHTIYSMVRSGEISADRPITSVRLLERL